MTYAQQKKIERMRAAVADAYDAADKAQGKAREKALAKWRRANVALDAYQDRLFESEARRAR